MSTTFAETWLSYLLSVGLRGSVLLGLAALGTLAFVRRSAGERHLLWAAGLGGGMLVTCTSWMLPAWRIAALPSGALALAAVLGTAAEGVAPALSPSPAPAAAPAPAGFAAEGGEAGGIAWVPLLVLAIWAVGVLWLLLRLLV